ncbi:MAG: hypothetical protein IRZ16_19965 [Myxococcaceae bacterium]|nr:hypothetical protein [Myxococcaceae bacterium]
MTFRSAVLLLVFPALSGAGCAFGPGEPFGTISPTLSARVDQDSGFTRLATGYEVRITAATFGVDALRLVGTTDEGSGQTLLEIPAGVPLIALSDDPEAVGTVPLTCDPSCGVDRGQLEAVQADLTSFEVVAEVRDSQTPARIAAGTYTVHFVASSSAEGRPLKTAVSLPFDEQHFPHVALDAALVGTPQMFEGVDFAALTGTTLDATQNTAARDAVLEAFAATALDVHTRRSP